MDFCDQCSCVLDLLSKVEVFVLPSYAEGMSNALLEAVVTGPSVVTSNGPGNVDVLKYESNGLLCTVEDVIALSSILRLFLDRPDLGQQLGIPVRQKVEQHRTLD